MDPYLALLIGVLFILSVCVIEFRQKMNNSFALMLPLIWYVSVVSRPVTLWLNHGSIDSVTDDNITWDPINIILYTSLTILGVMVLLRRRVNWQKIIKSNAWIILLLIYVGISFLWSDFPFVSIKRWIRATGAIVMVLVVLTDPNPIEAISRLLRICFLIHLTFSIILIKYFRPIGVEWDAWIGSEMWVGTTQGKNPLGQLAWTSGIYFLWSIMRAWGSNKKILIDIFLLIMALYLLKGSSDSSSVTSILGFLIGIIMLLFLHILRTRSEYLGRYLTLSIILIIIVFFIFQFIVEIFSNKSLISSTVEASGRNLTLTERTYIWSDIIDVASNSPILGVGYGSFWIGNLHQNLWDKYHIHLGQAHNGFLDVYLELGLVGVFILTCVIFFTYRNSFKTFIFNPEYGILRIVFLSIILLNNITESTLLKAYHQLWFLFLLVVVNIPTKLQLQDGKNILSE